MSSAPATAAVGGCGSGPDFNADGFEDLAVGVPGQAVDGQASSGGVHVIYGSASGLTGSADRFFTQNSSGMADESSASENFGWSLAAGDFDGDGRDDLAVGIPFQNVSGEPNAGAVHILYGSAAGLTSSGDQVFHQDISGIAGMAEQGDDFGYALASCDFDADGRDDLAVGVPFQALDGTPSVGAVHVIYGSAAGLTDSGDQVIHQDSSGITDGAGSGDRFGFSVAAGDFDADGRADLGVGVTGETIDGDIAGAVHVIYGSSAGLTASGDQLFHQDSSGMTDEAENFENFGFAVDSGDFDADGRDDLAVGVIGQTVNGFSFAGAVHIIYGSSTGLSASGDQVFHQNTSGMADEAGSDFFGSALTAADFDNDGRDDLGVGVPHEDVADQFGAGAVHTIYGASTGLTVSGDQLIHEDVSGMADSAELSDQFGFAVSAGDFDNDGRDDLAAGVPFEDFDGASAGGAVHVVYGTATGLTASGDQFLYQSAGGLADTPQTGDFFGGALIGSVFNFD